MSAAGSHSWVTKVLGAGALALAPSTGPEERLGPIQ